MPTGRNDPCPCGSGRKYKKCCLGREPAPGADVRPLWTADDRDRSLEQLDRFLDQAEMGTAREDAFSLFWGPLIESIGEEDRAERLLRNPTSQFAAAYWTLFDFSFEEDQRLVDAFLARFSKRLGVGERRWLETMRDSTARLWEVQDVRPGAGFSALDVWEGRRVIEVRERLGSEELVRWDLVAARLVEVAGGIHEVEGPPLVLPQSEKQPLLKELKSERRRIKRQSPGLDENDFFELMYPLIHDRWVRSVVDVAPPRLVTGEGDAMVIARVVFDVSDAEALRAALDADARFEANEGGSDASRSWVWLERGAAGESDAQARLLGHLDLDADRLVLQTYSSARAKAGRSLVESLVPSGVRHRGTTLEDPLQLARNARAQPDDEEEPPDLDPEEQARLEKEVKDEHYRGWLDESIPMLDGLTPREAARKRSARPKLLSLLKGLEAMEERAGKAGRPVYDATWIWRELGVRRR